MTLWLMPKDEVDRIEEILAREVSAEAFASKELTAVQAPLQVLPGGTAVIKVEGVLLNERNDLLDFFGAKQTAYKDIIVQTAEAQERGAKRIRYDISSPGGHVEGIYAAMDAIRSSSMPTKTVAINKLTSAAYMLASQTNHIEAMDDLTSVGSVGIAVDYLSLPFRKRFANTDSPKKRPDPEKEEDAAVIKEQLDDFYQVLAEKTADGRGVSVNDVKNNYGQGAVMTARTALAKGMIDSIRKYKKPASRSAETKEKRSMDREQLKTEHPEVYRSVFEDGVKAGASQELERVKGHLQLADGSGDVETARDDIESGTAITPSVMAKHQSAFMKRQMKADRLADNPPEIGHGGQEGGGGNHDDASKDAKAKAKFEAKHPGWEVSV